MLEQDIKDCHRNYMLTPTLIKRGAEVNHIMWDKSIKVVSSEEDLKPKEKPKQVGLFNEEAPKSERIVQFFGPGGNDD